MKIELYNVIDHDILDMIIGPHSHPVNPFEIINKYGKLVHTFKCNFNIEDLIIYNNTSYAVLAKINNLDENKVMLLCTSKIVEDDEDFNLNNEPTYEN